MSRPEIEVERICRFAGIPFEASMLEADADAQSRVAAGQEQWFAGLSESINVGSVGRWRTDNVTSRPGAVHLDCGGCAAPAWL